MPNNTHSRCNVCQKIGSKGYFRFPTNKKEAKNWLAICGLPEDTVINRSYFICYRHFALENLIEINGTFRRRKGIEPSPNILTEELPPLKYSDLPLQENPNMTIGQPKIPTSICHNEKIKDSQIECSKSINDTESNTMRIIELMAQFDPLAVSWEKIAAYVLDKITIRQIVLLKAKNDYGTTSMNLTSVKCLTNILEEFMDELSKISVEAVGKPSEPPSKAAKIIQSVTAHGLTRKVTKLIPKIPLIESEKSISVDAVEEPSIIDSKETEFVKQELPAEIEQNLSDFKKFPEPSPSISQSDNENPENVIKNVGHELRDEHHQYKELIEIKDELALDLEDSNLISDYQAWSKFPENEESGKPIIEDMDVSPA